MAFYEEMLDRLKVVYDPEIRINIVDLGLVYAASLTDDGTAQIKMTLTTLGCPVAEQLMQDVRHTAAKHPQVKSVDVELVWEPQWNRNMMSEEARLMLGM